VNKNLWVWMPHAGHFILGNECRFRLNTYVGKYIVSTVGEYLPDEGVREIYASSRGIPLEGRGEYRRADYMRKIGYEEIGCGRKYETMVFKAHKTKDKCCPYAMTSGELDFKGYNTPENAFAGHMKLCRKWSKK
jgi:hypothetical protein